MLYIEIKPVYSVTDWTIKRNGLKMKKKILTFSEGAPKKIIIST